MFGKKKETGPDKPCSMDQQTVTDIVRRSLETVNLKYNYLSDKNVFMTGFMGDDLPISMNILIDDLSVRFISYLDLKAREERFKEVVWELNNINKKLVFGAFYLDPEDGMITFEYSFPYIEANVSIPFIIGFLKMLVNTVDEYDGDLKKLAESIPHSDSKRNTMYG